MKKVTVEIDKDLWIKIKKKMYDNRLAFLLDCSVQEAVEGLIEEILKAGIATGPKQGRKK